jgi:hypothetical protein
MEKDVYTMVCSACKKTYNEDDFSDFENKICVDCDDKGFFFCNSCKDVLDATFHKVSTDDDLCDFCIGLDNL